MINNQFIINYLKEDNRGKIPFPHLLQELIDYNPYKTDKTMKEQIKELRVQIDGLAQLVKELMPIKVANEELAPYVSIDREGVKTITHLYVQSRQIYESYNSLILAKAWLGKVLGELGQENLYGSGYKTVEDIKPTADIAAAFDKNGEFHAIAIDWEEQYSSLSHIEKVDWLRQEISRVIKSIPDYQEYVDKIIAEKEATCETKEDYANMTFDDIPDIGNELIIVYQHLTEARFWLGFELERIKNNE